MLYCCTVDVITRKLPKIGNIRFPKAREKLLQLMIDDQNERAKKSFFSVNPVTRDAVNERENQRMDEALIIMKTIKSPSAKNIGLDGSRAMWLLALHNCDYKNAGNIVLKKMTNIYYRDRSQVFYPGIPYLIDRLKIVHKNHDHSALQLYGTQNWLTMLSDSTRVTGQFPISHPEGLDKRREKFGLVSPSSEKTKCKHTSEAR